MGREADSGSRGIVDTDYCSWQQNRLSSDGESIKLALAFIRELDILNNIRVETLLSMNDFTVLDFGIRDDGGTCRREEDRTEIITTFRQILKTKIFFENASKDNCHSASGSQDTLDSPSS